MFLIRDGERLPIASHGSHATCDGLKCPKCDGVLRIGGSGKRPSSDDRAWEADGYSLCCLVPVGLIRVEVDTIFGVREDEAVLNGRCRVYG